MAIDGGDGLGYDLDAPHPLQALVAQGQRKGLPVLTQSSRWSCLPTSFAMVLSKANHGKAGALLASIMEQLGRDDERGFHPQELLGIAVSLGFTFTPFEFEPKLERAPCKSGTWRDGECQVEKQVDVEGGVSWFPCEECDGSGLLPEAPLVFWHPLEVMQKHDGVLLGKRKGAEHHHAVAWCSETQMVLDPEHGVYQLDEFDAIDFWGCFALGERT